MRGPVSFVAVFLILFTAVGMFFFCDRASGEDSDWKLFSEGGAYRWYYDVKSVKVDKNIVKVWGKGVIKDRKGVDEKIKLLKKFGGQTMGYEKFSYTLNLFEIDCENRKHRIISVKDYDKKGNGLQTATMEDYPWDFIAPGTIIDNLAKEVCPPK